MRNVINNKQYNRIITFNRKLVSHWFMCCNEKQFCKFWRKFQISHDLIINFHIVYSSFLSHNAWNTRGRDIMKTHVNSKEQGGFCCERFGEVVNSRQTSRKNCKNLNIARKLPAARRTSSQNLIQREFSTSQRGRFCWLSFVHKGKVFYKRKKWGLSDAQKKSVVASKFTRKSVHF